MKQARVAWLLSVATLLMAAGAPGALGASYPSRPIQLIVPFAAGGGTDAVARAFAESAADRLGVPLVVVNRTGGSGCIGMTEGARARPDGYTVTMITREIVSLPALGLCPTTPDDFELVALLNEDPAMILVRADSPFQSGREIIEAAYKRPGEITYGSTAQPNFYVLAIEVTQGVRFNQIPFNGAAPTMTALLGGHVEFTMMNPGEAVSQLNAGRVRALAVLSEQRLQAFPDVPTLKELGYDVTSGTWRGLAVPKRTPAEVVERLASVTSEAVRDRRFASFMERTSLGIRYLPADAFRKYIEADRALAKQIAQAWKANQ